MLEKLNWASEEGFIVHVQDFKHGQKQVVEKVKKTPLSQSREKHLVNEINEHNLIDELWNVKCKFSAKSIVVLIGHKCISRTGTMCVKSIVSSTDVCQVWGIRDGKTLWN